MKVRFADCVLDADARSVCRGDATIHLSPKAFDFLAVLVEHGGRALSKVELLQRVWPETIKRVGIQSVGGILPYQSASGCHKQCREQEEHTRARH